MTKPRDAAHDSTTGEPKLDPRSPKEVDLHRYQVMTIPMELQQELASLKGPRLTEEDMLPPPPIEDVIKAHQGTSSGPPAAQATATHFIARYWVVLLGAVLGIALAVFLMRPPSGKPVPITNAVASVRAIDAARAPALHEPTGQQATVTPAVADTPQAENRPTTTDVNTAVSPPTAPVHPKSPPPKVASPANSSAAPRAIESTTPPRRSAFKPE